MRITKLLALSALTLTLAVPGTAGACQYCPRYDDGTRETEAHLDASDGDDALVMYQDLSNASPKARTGATLWVYAMAADCGRDGAGERLAVNAYRYDFDPCATWSTTAYEWHSFAVPIGYIAPSSHATVQITDLDPAVPVGADPIRSGHNAYYGIDTSRDYASDVRTFDGTGPHTIAGELMWWFDFDGALPLVGIYGSSLAYGIHDVGTSTTRTVWAENFGLGTATVSLAIQGPQAGDYAIVSDTCSGPLPPRQDCTFGLTFTPSAVGPRSATLVLSGSADGPQELALTGAGRTSVPPVSTITTADGSTLVATRDAVRGTVQGVAPVAYEWVTYVPDVPQVTTVAGRATLSCDPTGTTCDWSDARVLVPGWYTVTAYGVDDQGNAESGGPSIRVEIL
jgi:hypothetical protein